MRKNVWIVPCSIALAALTIWTACKKNTSASSDNTSRTTLITAASWKFDSAGIDLNKDGIIDVVDTTLLPCQKDNTYTFNKDSTGVMDEGATKCNSTDPQTTAFTWSFSGTGQSVIKSNANPLLANGINIFSMTSTKMVLYKDTTVFGANIWYVVDLKH
ncbi:MAG TPA: lipocalin family protein [Puia sp.]